MKVPITSVILFLTIHAVSTAHVVAPDGSGDFPTIQAALDFLPDGSVIELTDGTFQGDGNRDLDFYGKEITLRSQNGEPESCIIDLEGTVGDMHGLASLGSYEGSSATIEGITITNGYMEFGGAIQIYEMTNPTIERCIFVDNFATFAGGAVGGFGGATILGCTFYRNGAPYGGQLYFEDWGGLIVENTIIAFSAQGPGLEYSATGAYSLTCCDIYGNAGGDWVGNIAGFLGINGNICLDPLFCSPQDLDLHLRSESPCAPFTPPNEECNLIGALPVSSASALQETSWGRLKSLFAK